MYPIHFGGIVSILYTSIGIFNKNVTHEYYMFESSVCYYNVVRIKTERVTPLRRK